jgi:hypothetical protein
MPTLTQPRSFQDTSEKKCYVKIAKDILLRYAAAHLTVPFVQMLLRCGLCNGNGRSRFARGCRAALPRCAKAAMQRSAGTQPPPAMMPPFRTHRASGLAGEVREDDTNCGVLRCALDDCRRYVNLFRLCLASVACGSAMLRVASWQPDRYLAQPSLFLANMLTSDLNSNGTDADIHRNTTLVQLLRSLPCGPLRRADNLDPRPAPELFQPGEPVMPAIPHQ